MRILNIGWLVLLLCTRNANAQDKQALSKEYQTFINKAELCIINAQEQDALDNYSQAFGLHKAFAADLHNAIVCAIHTAKDSLAMAYCFQLARKGVGGAYFSQKAFRALKTQKQWQKLQTFATTIKDSLDQKNRNFKIRLEGLLEKDQDMAFRNRTLIAQPNKSVWESVLKSTDSISNELLKIYREEGFLGEDQLGVPMANDTSIVPNHRYDVMIRHAFQGGAFEFQLAFIQLFREALLNGKLNPQSVKMYLLFMSVNSGEEHYFVINDCKLYKQRVWSESFQWKTEQNRKEFLLCPLSDYEAKLMYRLTHPHNNFLFYGTFERTSNGFKNEEERNFFLEQYIPVDVVIPNCK